TLPPFVSTTENLTRATVGITAQAKNGFFGGIGVSWNVPTRARDGRFTDTTAVMGDYYDWQLRIGYPPGVRVYGPPPPPPTRPPVRTYTFEDVYFDFDRYSLRPEATRVLDEAVTAMRETATLRLEIEGHTCNIGTAEYNLALGDRRANAVKDYLVSRGISADRLRTVSYGEERPKYDNAREETRRLNRRAALTVNLRR